MKTEISIWLKTAAALIVLLLFFFAQGAIAVITGIEGIPSALIRGAVIWSLVILTLAYYIIRYKGISGLGFRKMKSGALKRTLYFTPLLIIAFSHFAVGINLNAGEGLVLANLFFTLGIGMAEEIFFRGIICNMWVKCGGVRAMLVSSVLFGMSHILNAAGGASLVATVLQICFACVYGMVFALIFIEGNSLVPCVLLHTLHDFCSFISEDGSLRLNIILGVIQFAVLTAYFFYLFYFFKRTDKEILGEKAKSQPEH